MVSAQALHTIVGIIGNVISFGLFLSPAPTFYGIIKKKSTEEFSPVPYMAAVLNCLLWVFYGLPFIHPDSLLVITINGVGLALELIYLAIFFTYSDSKGRKKVAYGLSGTVAFGAAVATAALLGFHGTTRRSLFVGVLCDVFNIIMYAAPLTVMFKVIKTRSVKYMPFTLSLASLLNAFIWTSYSLIIFDIYILVCNGLGSFLAIIQLILYGYYYFFGVKEVEEDHKVAQPSELEIV